MLVKVILDDRVDKLSLELSKCKNQSPNKKQTQNLSSHYQRTKYTLIYNLSWARMWSWNSRRSTLVATQGLYSITEKCLVSHNKSWWLFCFKFSSDCALNFVPWIFKCLESSSTETAVKLQSNWAIFQPYFATWSVKRLIASWITSTQWLTSADRSSNASWPVD